MEFETIIICALVCIIGLLIWWQLGVMDDRRRMQCALDKARGVVSAADWCKIVDAYDNALKQEVTR
jgi:hypothetical protein